MVGFFLHLLFLYRFLRNWIRTNSSAFLFFTSCADAGQHTAKNKTVTISYMSGSRLQFLPEKSLWRPIFFLQFDLRKHISLYICWQSNFSYFEIPTNDWYSKASYNDIFIVRFSCIICWWKHLNFYNICLHNFQLYPNSLSRHSKRFNKVGLLFGKTVSSFLHRRPVSHLG